MDIVAIVALGRPASEEAPTLAADLGVTSYEVSVMLRAPTPIVVLRSEDRARTVELLGKLRSRGHEAVACELDAVVSSDDMFRPKSFRFDGNEFIGQGGGREHRLCATDVAALVRATHESHLETTVKTRERKISVGRVAMSGGLMMTKEASGEARRVTDEREAVLYVYRSNGPAWLLASTQMRYDGLGADMRRSRTENFEVLVKTLRELAPSAPYDVRLLAVHPSPTVIAGGPKHLSASSSGTIDLLAHIVALSLGRAARPYR